MAVDGTNHLLPVAFPCLNYPQGHDHARFLEKSVGVPDGNSARTEHGPIDPSCAHVAASVPIGTLHLLI